jgi:Mg-chelatase subunit ChlD
MKKDYTHIAIILDRTGSMESIRDDIIGGFNAFLNQQKAEPNKATLTLIQFDTQDPYEVLHKFKPIEDVPELTRETFVPRAATPLLDAMGRGINDLENSLAEMKENEKPSRVIIVIITDGQENSSLEFRKDQIEKMIKEKQEKASWQFVFLGADLAAIGDALATGIHATSTMSYDKTARGTKEAWISASMRIAAYRSGRSKNVSFTDEDRAKQDSEKKRK